MSRIRDVLKNKNKIAKQEERIRQEKISEVKSDALYTMRLTEDLKKVDMLFEDSTLEEIRVKVNERDQAKFMKACYSELMSEYEIRQFGDIVVIRRKAVAFY
jgi:hypothetical protein